METAKQKIETYVKTYEELMPQEFELFSKGLKAKIDLQETKFGDVKGSEIDMRAIAEMPENLYVIINRQLTEEEFNWFTSKKGQRWFAKTYKQYRASEKV